jgi:hypothetical protein
VVAAATGVVVAAATGVVVAAAAQAGIVVTAVVGAGVITDGAQLKDAISFSDFNELPAVSITGE